MLAFFEVALAVALVHVCEVSLCFLRGEHGCAVCGDAHRGKNLRLEVVTKSLASDALEEYAGEVDINLDVD